MNLAAVMHRANNEFCYALDKDTVVVTLKTAKDVESVDIIHEDPFIHELKGKREWFGKKAAMRKYLELERHYIWRIELKPPFKRLQYYFEIKGGGMKYAVFENKIVPVSKIRETSIICFKFPWLNPTDVIAPPEWVRDTVWYQIMPERFARSSDFVNDGRFRDWGDVRNRHWYDKYGGSLRGITEKLPYLHELGITGIYMTPIFRSPSSHKYDTTDYKCIDPDFGTEDDIRELVEKAHGYGIRIMLDAVFNHCGRLNPIWLDVRERGKDSPYYNWFFINKDNFAEEERPTDDGRFYSFSFWSVMPKMNTNNPEVVQYFAELSTYWVQNWGIDGIRFDVGDEVSHSFMKSVYASLKAVRPDVFLLGEIWYDSLPWVTSKEYDSVMNYPISGCANDFFRHTGSDVRKLIYTLNFCRSLYPEQVTRVLFNFLDTHDTARASESCKNNDVLLQKLAFLLSLPGTPCLYYGTELALRGTPQNLDYRQCMPWKKINDPDKKLMRENTAALIHLRNENPAMRSNDIEFIIDDEKPGSVRYIKSGKLTVFLNASKQNFNMIPDGKILYSNCYENNTLYTNGILIWENIQ